MILTYYLLSGLLILYDARWTSSSAVITADLLSGLTDDDISLEDDNDLITTITGGNSSIISDRRSLLIDDKNNDVNQEVDIVLAALSHYVIEHQLDTIPVPDIKKSFKIKLHRRLKVHGKFEATHGHTGAMSTLRRTGNAVISRPAAGTIYTKVSLGFGKLYLKFDHYKIKVSKIHVSGKIDVDIHRNSLTLAVTGKLNPADGQCTVTVNTLTLDQLSDFKIHITGLGKLGNKLANTILTWAANHYREKIKGKIESTLRDKVQNVIRDKNFCRF